MRTTTLSYKVSAAKKGRDESRPGQSLPLLCAAKLTSAQSKVKPNDAGGERLLRCREMLQEAVQQADGRWLLAFVSS
jgi:hypothetical protein